VVVVAAARDDWCKSDLKTKTPVTTGLGPWVSHDRVK